MKSTKAGNARGFRPKGKTLERITFAEQFGVNINEVVNKTLDAHIEPYLKAAIEEKKSSLKKLIDVPLP